MEQHVIARRVALLAGMGAIIFMLLNALSEAFWRGMDATGSPVSVDTGGAVLAFSVLLIGLAAAYASLIFKGRNGAIAEATALLAMLLYILSSASSLFGDRMIDPMS